MYCIYTDKEITCEESNSEHIIPLSLGGCDTFSIQVDKKKNSELGTRIDGKFSNDYLISSLRRHKDFRGHSGKIPETKWTKSLIEGTNKPIQIIFKGKKTHFYDPVMKRTIVPEELKGTTISSVIQFDKDIRMLFLAKVILSAGYFVYGQKFRDHADHKSLRTLMNFKLSETKESIKGLKINIVDPLRSIPEDNKGLVGVFQNICKGTNSSCVIFLLCNNHIVGSVGIGGEYIGSLSFQAETDNFPNDGKFKLGHVVGIQENELRRSSFYHMVELLSANISQQT